MSKPSKPKKIVMPSTAENKKILAAAKRDPDAQPLSAKQLKNMIPLQSLRGRPKLAETKQLVSVRYSPKVIEYFRATGDGWQSRMDEILLKYVVRQSRKELP
jgi:uncharacterized protein (DUF4415 family)